VLYVKAAVVGEPGAPERLVGTTQDITERYRKEQERERLLQALDAEKRWLDALIAQSPSGVILVKEDGSILFNQRLSELFGFNIDPTLGVVQFEPYFFDVKGQALPNDQQPGSRVLKGEVIRTGEFLIRRPDGSEIFILGSGAPVYDQTQKLVGAIGIIEEITRRVQWEKTREQWMAVIAHDLRQPLATIMARADLLTHREHRQPESLRDLDAIRASSQLMNRMIGDMLDASLIEASQLTLLRVMVDIRRIVRETVEHFAGCGAAISVHAGRETAHAFADRQRIEQVLGNLLTNALKYGKAKAPIDVRIRQDAGEVRVEVANRGEVAKSEAAHLFERYYRTGASKRRGVEGTGLGLYIVKGIVDAHGGKVGLRSEHGKTTVWFSLPKFPREGEHNPPA
jgi:PAS domain S-box-containing protein